jgi:hypothetical protein
LTSHSPLITAAGSTQSPTKSSSEPSPNCAKTGLQNVTVNVTVDDVIT